MAMPSMTLHRPDSKCTQPFAHEPARHLALSAPRPQTLPRADLTRPLSLVRSLGDGDLKACGLTAEPEVTRFTLDAQDYCLLLASDGLWDLVGNQEALDLIHDTVKHPVMCAQR